jgi:hypothetical protein
MARTSVTLRFPDVLLALIDAEAKRSGQTRTSAIINGMWQHTTREVVVEVAGSIPAPRSKHSEPKKIAPANRAGKLRISTSCPDCGSLGGMHQKWCKAKG